MTKLGLLSSLGLALSEKQIPQAVEKFESGDKPKEALERAVMRPRQVRYQAALRPDISGFSFNYLASQSEFRKDETRTCQAKWNLKTRHC